MIYVISSITSSIFIAGVTTESTFDPLVERVDANTFDRKSTRWQSVGQFNYTLRVAALCVIEPDGKRPPKQPILDQGRSREVI
ncbi:MAG: hypothetical protein CL784_07965 [Chloroflexi bacterium]|nr:hypothetical protein [Chloroflexota bacterium]